MSTSVGIGLAFVAMLCWGFGDFLIQKSTRKIGDFETLFIICGFGALILLPFVWRDIPATIADNKGLLILFAGGIILFFAALLYFEDLRPNGKMRKTLHDAVALRGTILPMAILDNTAWVAFAFAMSLAPIAIAVALSESYIIVAVILGLLVNRERIQFHQKIGLILAVIAAITLAAITAA